MPPTVVRDSGVVVQNPTQDDFGSQSCNESLYSEDLEVPLEGCAADIGPSTQHHSTNPLPSRSHDSSSTLPHRESASTSPALPVAGKNEAPTKTAKNGAPSSSSWVSRWRSFAKQMGPGIIFAVTTIGTSHLVQSTRAGARFGMSVSFFIFLAIIAKYPFFEMGTRYAAATRESLLEGYKRQGTWILWTFFVFMLVYMVLKISALCLVTAGTLAFLFGIPPSFPLHWIAGIVAAVNVGILSVGGFGFLDGMMKGIAAVLTISTLVATIAALVAGPRFPDAPAFDFRDFFTGDSISFLIALMGWMPTGIETSAFSSTWTVEKMRKRQEQLMREGREERQVEEARGDTTASSGETEEEVQHRREAAVPPPLTDTEFRNSIIDLRVGYGLTTVTALMFVTMGSLILYGSGEILSGNSAVFAGQVVGMYGAALGSWSRYFIGASATCTVLSTAMSFQDGAARICIETLRISGVSSKASLSAFLWMGAMAGASFGLFFALGTNVKFVMDVATSVSFCVSWLFAYLNYRVVQLPHVAEDRRLPFWLKPLSWFGIAVLFGFSVLFVVVKLDPALL